jgi:hypothetical protein
MSGVKERKGFAECVREAVEQAGLGPLDNYEPTIGRMFNEMPCWEIPGYKFTVTCTMFGFIFVFYQAEQENIVPVTCSLVLDDKDAAFELMHLCLYVNLDDPGIKILQGEPNLVNAVFAAIDLFENEGPTVGALEFLRQALIAAHLLLP